jgi:hypothetical protein
LFFVRQRRPWSTLINIAKPSQGRREGVKGVTVSQGPDLKMGPGDLENKRKIGYSKRILLFWAPKLSGLDWLIQSVKR